MGEPAVIKHRHISQLVAAIAALMTLGMVGPLAASAVAAEAAVTTGQAKPIGQTSATLNGTVTPNGEEVTECEFKYGRTTAYESTVPCNPSSPLLGEPAPVTAAVSGLSPNTTYHFRIVAKTAGGPIEGKDVEFPTLPLATVTTGEASGIGQTSAGLNATVNPNGEEVKECWFEYGTSTSYEARVPCGPGPAPFTGAVSAMAEPLAPGTTYHFRIVALVGAATIVGADAEFPTLPAPPPPPTEPPPVTPQPSTQPPPPPTTPTPPTVEALVRAPLLAHITTRVVHGRILELSFHLSVKARVRLLAKRGRRIVAKTGWRTFPAGDRKLLLRLNLHRWPNRLNVQTHAFGPLPLITAKERAALG